MENVLESPYVNVGWDAKNAIITLQWTAETQNMQETDFKELLLEAADFVERNKAKYWLADTKDFDYVIEPELQEWTAGKFNQQLLNARLQKMAVITPTTFFTQIAIQQTTDEMAQKQKGGKFKFSYFDDLDKARGWLLE